MPLFGQKTKAFRIICALIFLSILLFVFLWFFSPVLHRITRESTNDFPSGLLPDGCTYLSQADKNLTIPFKYLPEKDSAMLDGKDLEYYVFLQDDSKLYFWGEMNSSPVFEDEYNCRWRELHKNMQSKNGSSEKTYDLVIPESGDFQIAFLFLRGEPTDPRDFYVPNSTTEYAYRVFSKQEIRDLVYENQKKKEFISCRDLNLEFKTEDQVIRDKTLYEMVLHAFFRPNETGYFSDVIVDYTDEFLDYLNKCEKYAMYLMSVEGAARVEEKEEDNTHAAMGISFELLSGDSD